MGWDDETRGSTAMGIRRNKTILEQAADYVDTVVETAREKAGPAIADAFDKAGPMLTDAKDKAGPALVDAKDKAVPYLVDAKDKATPYVAAGLAAAATQASQAADYAAEKAADLKAEVTGEPRKKHRLRNILVVTGIAALLGFIAKKLSSGGDQDNWQSSYTPPAPPRDADRTDSPIGDAAAAAVVTEGADEGGAGPDEALADAAEESHDVTTPDDPAEIVDLEQNEEAATNKSAKG
jgi:hypothetical protein